MKALIKIALLSALLSVVYGCASESSTYKTRLPPPDSFNPNFMAYQKLAGQKVMVIAVDPTGHWAFGYDHGKASLEEAAENATLKCEKSREKYYVFAKPRLFAINNEIVYYDEK